MYMKIVRTADLPDKAFISSIQTDNNNKKKVNFRVDQSEGLEQNRIKITGRE